MDELEPVAVLGAGAVGCFFGGLLARAGVPVTLIGRAALVQALDAGPLVVEMGGERLAVPERAAADPSAAQHARLVLVCVKSTDTAAAAQQLAPHLRPDAIVVSLQNGIANAACLQERLPVPVLPAAVYVAVEMAGPGQVRHHGRSELIIPDVPAAPKLAALFARAHVPVDVSDNVAGVLWAKLVVNCAFNGLSAIAQQPYGRLFASPGVPRMLRDIVDECRAVAAAEGVIIPGDPWAGVEAIAATMATQTSSTAHDVARGRRSEIDFLNGWIVRLGEQHGVATPVNRTVHTLVRLLEQVGRTLR